MRLQVLESYLRERGIEADVTEVELGDLVEDERTAVIDRMVAGCDLPMVLVEGRVACADGVDLRAIAEAAASA